jgi:hypothetical protein
MQHVERVWHRRLRWRLRGAWQWPAFVVLTLVDGLVLALLPFYGDGSGGFMPGLLLAGFLNLFAIAVLAPAVGRLVRRRRPDLPRLVASDYAGAGLLCGICVLLVAGGVAHRPAVAASEDDERAVARAMHDYVVAHEPTRRAGLAAIDAMRLEAEYYRACIPGSDPRHWVCMFVSTERRPVRMTRDPDETPNSAYRVHGGFE